MVRNLMGPAVLSLVSIAVLTIWPAIHQGKFTNRWQIPAKLAAAAAALENFPNQIGSWEAAEPGDRLSEGVMKELGLAGYVSRYYRRRGSDDFVLLLLMVGQPGPLVRHPPDICFANQANNLLGESKINIDGSNEDLHEASSFRVLRYQHDSKLRNPFRVAYAFTIDGNWSVPKMPRITYGGASVLYKVHVQAVDPPFVESSDKLPLDEFIKQFVPAFTQYLERAQMTAEKQTTS
ncbi:MAG: exosortase-associated EpsI family protein [Pirellulales bacterium]